MNKGKARWFMDKQELTYAIKMKGLELGFSKVGITNAEDFSDYIEETVETGS